eukprot:m.41479 g.41479  ORF g.41479 m.41479 type:complete len:316 (-) comp10561_c1_seq2:142-1089(-)
MSDDYCADCAECQRRQQPAWKHLVRRSTWKTWLENISLNPTDPEFRFKYALDTDKLSPLCTECYVELDCDSETQEFLEHCDVRFQSFCPILTDYLTLYTLSPFCNRTTLNGLAGRGRMFVLSTEQARRVLRLDSSVKLDRLLDIGAGDGYVTKCLAPLFHNVEVTETNVVMRFRLRRWGWLCHNVETWLKTPYKYDVISCLNVLDRCDRALDLISDMKSKLTPNGLILIALVHPYNPFVDDHGARGRRPSQPLAIDTRSFETALNSFEEKVAKPLGLRLKSVAKVPYLCEGDMYRRYYYLSDTIIVLQNTAADKE